MQLKTARWGLPCGRFLAFLPPGLIQEPPRWTAAQCSRQGTAARTSGTCAFRFARCRSARVSRTESFPRFAAPV
jgi:hypothetical protein